MNTWLSRTECSQGREPLRGSHGCLEPPAPPQPSHRPSPRCVLTQTPNSQYLDVAESLVKVVHSKTDKGVGHLLALRFWVHSPVRRWSPNFLSAPPQHLHPEIIITYLTTESDFILFCTMWTWNSTGSKYNLEISWWGPAADGQGDLVVEEVDDQVQVDRLLPVHIGVANW